MDRTLNFVVLIIDDDQPRGISILRNDFRTIHTRYADMLGDLTLLEIGGVSVAITHSGRTERDNKIPILYQEET